MSKAGDEALAQALAQLVAELRALDERRAALVAAIAGLDALLPKSLAPSEQLQQLYRPTFQMPKGTTRGSLILAHMQSVCGPVTNADLVQYFADRKDPKSDVAKTLMVLKRRGKIRRLSRATWCLNVDLEPIAEQP